MKVDVIASEQYAECDNVCSMNATCKIDGCDSLAKGLGMCNLHYGRFRRHGDVDYVAPHLRSGMERIMRNVEVDPISGCWLWTKARRSGYATCRYDKRMWYVHRLTYVLAVGPVPDGLELDHLCRVRHCVNPAHLEPVTRRENLRRGDTFAARNAAKTHCPAGHPYDKKNTYIQPNGGRRCRRCHADRVAAARTREGGRVG